MKTIVKGTYGKVREYEEMSKTPEVGDEWIGRGYEDAKVIDIANVNDEVAETTSGDPTADFTFFRVYIQMDGDEFTEYVAVHRGYDTEETPKERYDRKNTKVYTLKLNRNTDAALIEQLDTVENRQGYIKSLIRADITR